jgi:Sigma-70, region 4
VTTLAHPLPFAFGPRAPRALAPAAKPAIIVMMMRDDPIPMAMPERQAMAVSLRFIEGLSNPDIAAIMDIGVEAVESLTARGKRALTTRLTGRKDALGYDDDT